MIVRAYVPMLEDSGSPWSEMGNFLGKSNDDYKERISELSKTITTPKSYDSVVNVMFGDGNLMVGNISTTPATCYWRVNK